MPDAAASLRQIGSGAYWSIAAPLDHEVTRNHGAGRKPGPPLPAPRTARAGADPQLASARGGGAGRGQRFVRSGSPGGDNEMLEFLGDAVLGLATSEALFHRFPEFQEGHLSKLRAHLVGQRHLLRVAEQLQIGHYMRLGRGEEKSGGRNKASLLVDALEAILAALYLDGGWPVARDFIVRAIVEPELAHMNLETSAMPVMDFKSALQEALQARGGPQPVYALVKEEGPEHKKTFTVEVRLPAAGTGANRGARPGCDKKTGGTGGGAAGPGAVGGVAWDARSQGRRAGKFPVAANHVSDRRSDSERSTQASSRQLCSEFTLCHGVEKFPPGIGLRPCSRSRERSWSPFLRSAS